MYVEKHERMVVADSDSPDIPLLFIHGFNNTTKTWVPLLPYFTQYTRIMFDVEPHGRTGVSGKPINTPNHAIDVDDILAYFGYNNAIIVAHSAGTLIAMQFAHDFPGKAKRLVLLGPLMQPLPAELLDITELVRTQTFEQIVAINTSWLSEQCKERQDLLALIASEVERHEDRREYLARYFDGMARYKFEGVGGVETWVIRGLQDTAVHKGAEESVRALTNARMLDVDTGHYFAWEDLPATVAAVRTALG